MSLDGLAGAKRSETAENQRENERAISSSSPILEKNDTHSRLSFPSISLSTNETVVDGLKYAKSHEWAKIDGDTATVGITDFAQVRSRG